ncbi:MAG: hypothetical protein ACRC6I_12435, partial [Paracoccaceae bacterium]
TSTPEASRVLTSEVAPFIALPLFIRRQAITLWVIFQPASRGKGVSHDGTLSHINEIKGLGARFRLSLRFRPFCANHHRLLFRREAAQRAHCFAQQCHQPLPPCRAVLQDQIAAMMFMDIFRTARRIMPRHCLYHPQINRIYHFSIIPFLVHIAILPEIAPDSESGNSIRRKMKLHVTTLARPAPSICPARL